MNDPTRRNPVPDAVAAQPRPEVPATEPELPVVARLIVEIRSDGSRTVARGAMEDAASGTRASIEASGRTPLDLAMKLAQSIVAAPWFKASLTRGAIRRLLKR